MHVRTKLILGLAGALLVAACEDSDSGKTTTTSGNELGDGFAAMFAADPLSGPVDAQSVSVTPVSKTTDPFNP